MLSHLLDPKKPLIIGDSTVYSWYSSTKVINEDKLENEIIEKLNSRYSNVKITWGFKREILRK